MPKQDYIAATDIKHGRSTAEGGEVIEYSEGEPVDPEHFTEAQFQHLIEIGTLVPQPVSRQAEHLEDEVAKLRAQLAEKDRQLRELQGQTEPDAVQGPDPSHAGAAFVGPTSSTPPQQPEVATPEDLRKAAEEGGEPKTRSVGEETPAKATSAPPAKVAPTKTASAPTKPTAEGK